MLAVPGRGFSSGSKFSIFVTPVLTGLERSAPRITFHGALDGAPGIMRLSRAFGGSAPRRCVLPAAMRARPPVDGTNRSDGGDLGVTTSAGPGPARQGCPQMRDITPTEIGELRRFLPVRVTTWPISAPSLQETRALGRLHQSRRRLPTESGPAISPDDLEVSPGPRRTENQPRRSCHDQSGRGRPRHRRAHRVACDPQRRATGSATWPPPPDPTPATPGVPRRLGPACRRRCGWARVGAHR
jgi:hypothetical protein